eukprot:5926687-Pleurochrysis_carterae.AAC.3
MRNAHAQKAKCAQAERASHVLDLGVLFRHLLIEGIEFVSTIEEQLDVLAHQLLDLVNLGCDHCRPTH